MTTQFISEKVGHAKTQPQVDEPEKLVQLHERFVRSAVLHPQAIALIAGDEIWTYERLARYVTSLAQGLVAQGRAARRARGAASHEQS